VTGARSASTGDDVPDGTPEVVHGRDEEIDEAAAESFPASDAPQWWSGDQAGEPVTERPD
jgi:hypothetical protein